MPFYLLLIFFFLLQNIFAVTSSILENKREVIDVQIVIVNFWYKETVPYLLHFTWDKDLDAPFVDPTLACGEARGRLRYNEKLKMLHVCTGMGKVQTSIAITSLGMDRRFNFKTAYWIGAGDGGIDPQIASFGSVAIVDFVIDGDDSLYISPLESDFPKDKWISGFQDPYSPPPKIDLNPKLIQTMFEETKNIKFPQFQKITEKWNYTEPETRNPSKVVIGAAITSDRYFIGSKQAEWARNWIKQYNNKTKSKFAVSAMEDIALAKNLGNLHHMKLVNSDRLLILRAGSDYVYPPPNITIDDWPSQNEYDAPAISNLFTVVKTIIEKITNMNREENILTQNVHFLSFNFR